MRLEAKKVGILLMMQWTAPTTGIAMCQHAASLVNLECRFMARNGSSNHHRATSALPPTADAFYGFEKSRLMTRLGHFRCCGCTRRGRREAPVHADYQIDP